MTFVKLGVVITVWLLVIAYVGGLLAIASAGG